MSVSYRERIRPSPTPARPEAAPSDTAPADELADFVPTITRVRINRRGERVVTSETRLDPGELRRRRRLRREPLAAQLAAGPGAAPAEAIHAAPFTLLVGGAACRLLAHSGVNRCPL